MEPPESSQSVTVPDELLDAHGRPLRSLRLSVTDRCNLRCQYCMPEESYRWLPRAEILSFEELLRVTRAFRYLGVTKLRLTGGEPLLRQDLTSLVSGLALQSFETLAMTSNGVLMGAQAASLRAAGLESLTISLDTLRPARFRELTRRDSLRAVLDGIEAARAAGFHPLKLDTVLIRGFNDDEAVDLLEQARRWGAELRFIEYMDVGGATHWKLSKVVSRRRLLERLVEHYGPLEPLGGRGAAPAERFRTHDGLIFGVIPSVTEPFCGSCDRMRLTADGHCFLCLYAQSGLDLRKILRAGVTDADLTEAIRAFWSQRRDRGAEQRQHASGRSSFLAIDQLRENPLLEMHTRGG
jgi:cyclic pyranopterin phosphate synthase